MAGKPTLDLTLYLVTDSTPGILGAKDICEVVESALKGGVTVVQYRDKHAETSVLIETASRIHAITQKYHVPLLINDRLDVCLAVGAEGVHIGQDDTSLDDAKKLLPPNAIIGVTASSVEEAENAIAGGADYLGVGTVFATPTKKDTKHIIGTRGTQEILARCKAGSDHSIGCVAIGSINAMNVQRILHQSKAGTNRLNGVAVVSAIMASVDPESAASELKARIEHGPHIFYTAGPPGLAMAYDAASFMPQVPLLIGKHASASILSHNMTNTVVQNFAANVCLAAGASPIMSTNAAEAGDLAKLGGGLVVNMGTITADIMNAYQAGAAAYNASGNPVVFDPVGGGATSVRRTAIQTLLKAAFFDVIKGNEGEIGAVLGSTTTQQRGVDSGPSTSDAKQKAGLVKALAQREHCIALMTGATDYLSDGTRTLAISNGSSLLGKITGSGCALGSIIASYLSLAKKEGLDKMVATLAAILHYEIAAERAEKQDACNGPGTFIPAFLDQLHWVAQNITHIDIATSAKIELVDVQRTWPIP